MLIASTEKKEDLHAFADANIGALYQRRNSVTVWRAAMARLSVINFPSLRLCFEFHQPLLLVRQPLFDPLGNGTRHGLHCAL